ncbi:preprotein translocase subunit YajC [Lysinimonas soli]|uniref:Preprotein translocase subunit YajC n=1 Tax=Lysinimonas soli TaxID=1074233 RepID=A0ABW0NMY1_9MICO
MSFAPILVHAAAASSSGPDYLTIGLVVVLAVMVIFMFRNSRKRKREAEELKSKFVPGAEVMTQHGIYGTLISIDEEKNEAVIETTPGTKLRVHRQTISRVIDPVEAEQDVIEEPAAPEVNEDHAVQAGEPQYGERLDEDKPKRAPRKKAAE